MSNVPPPPPPPPPGFGGGYPPSAPPPGYGGPGYNPYGYPSNQREHPDGTSVLVLGILGLVLCQILSPIAWVKGNSAKRDMDSQPGVVWTNRGNITAGRILGIIGTCMILLSVLIVAVLIAAAAASTN